MDTDSPSGKERCSAIVQSLTDNGADVNAEDYDGQRALHWAARARHREML